MNKALFIDYDNTVRISSGKYPYPINPSEIIIIPKVVEYISEFRNNGYLILGVSNQSCIARGIASIKSIKKCFKHTNKLIGGVTDYKFCPHLPDNGCNCRKPNIQMGAEFIDKYNLDIVRCHMIGDMETDEKFAINLGISFTYVKYIL